MLTFFPSVHVAVAGNLPFRLIYKVRILLTDVLDTCPHFLFAHRFQFKSDGSVGDVMIIDGSDGRCILFAYLSNHIKVLSRG